MEAFDISNTNGYENVASMVVFEKGKAKKSDYRKFKIRTVAGPDDYRCMEEALTPAFLSRDPGEGGAGRKGTGYRPWKLYPVSSRIS